MADFMKEYEETGKTEALVNYVETTFNIKKEEAEVMVKEVEQELLSMHGKDNEATFRKKLIILLRTRYSKQFKSIASMVTFEGVILYVGQKRDMWANAKNKIAQQVRDAVKNDSTDVLIRNKIISCVVPITATNVDELIAEFLNDAIPMEKRRLLFLTPAVTAQGIPSKTPHAPIRTSVVQNVVGFGSPKDSQNPLVFDLQLSGAACSDNLKPLIGKPIRFYAGLNQAKSQSSYILRTNRETNFQIIEDSDVGRALANYELNALIEKFMPEILVTVKQVQEKGAQGPEELRKWLGIRNFCIIKDAVVTRMDFNPSAKNMIKIYVMDENADFKDQEQMCLYPAEEGDNIDFIEGTKVAIVARPFCGTDRDDKTKFNAMVTAEVFIPYKDFKFEKADVPELSAESVKARDDRLQDML